MFKYFKNKCKTFFNNYFDKRNLLLLIFLIIIIIINIFVTLYLKYKFTS
jgi:flagellar biosynthesis/type III secretory pathway M-ring protein FliF/YscJ